MKSNLRLYGQMKKQRWEESEKRREERRSEKRRSQVRRQKMQVREKVAKSRNTVFFPTCQVRVVRFYQSCSPPPPPLHPPPPSPPPPPPRSPDPSGHSRTSTASARSQWALPDLHRELQIPVGTAGPQPRAPDPSGHCRTSTAR